MYLKQYPRDSNKKITITIKYVSVHRNKLMLNYFQFL